MSEPSITIRLETADDAAAIERLHERTFGPGRLAKTAYRIREGAAHSLELSFTARIGTLMIGSVRLTRICIGAGQALIERALAEAKAKGHQLVVLVGDEPYYGRSGFKRIAKGQAVMPGPVDPDRLLVCELRE